MAYSCSKFNHFVCLFVEIIQRWFCLRLPTHCVHASMSRSSKRVWAYMPCISLKSCHVWMLYLKYCPRYGYYSTSETLVKFEKQLWPQMKSTVIGLEKMIQTLSRTIFTANSTGIAWTVFEIIEPLLMSWLRFVWHWMKVKVNAINTRCITRS